MVSLTIVGVLVPYNNEQLLGGASSFDVKASPFVIAVQTAGIPAIPSIMNVVVMIAVLSVGNCAIYGASRTLAALADVGQAPKMFSYIDNSGRPLVGILFSSLFGLLSYIVCAGQATMEKAFTWLMATNALAAIFTWASICVCHIRFRQGTESHETFLYYYSVVFKG
jgi:amino acid transporter